MAQRIQCACGKTFKIPEKFAGKKIRCLSCKQVLRLYPDRKKEERAPAKPGIEIEDRSECPGCGAIYVEATKICLRCGINLKTGAVVYSPADDKSSDDLDWSSEESFLQRRGILRQLFDRLIGGQ